VGVKILIGDVRARLAELPDDHFDCVVTSPPYWGLRSYLDASHIDKPLEMGLEPTLGEHLDALITVMREVRRVLKPTGVCWLNYGDCYATSPNGRSAAATKAAGQDDRTFRDKPFSTVGPIRGGAPSDKSTLRGNGHVGGGPKLKALQPTQLQQVTPPESGQPFPADIGRRGGGNAPAGAIFVPDYEKTSMSGKTENGGNVAAAHGGRVMASGYLKPKDLCLIPQRLAIALQEDGWWVRSVLPWVKRNGMPESIRDRPATSIEYVIMLTKSERYLYDAEAVRRPASPNTNARVSQNVSAQAGGLRANGGAKTNGAMKAVVRGSTKQDATAAAAAAAGGSSGRRMSGFNERWDAAGGKRRPKAADAGSGIRSNDSFEAATSAEVLHDRNFRNSDLFFDSLEAPYGLISNADGVPIALDVCPQPFKDAHFATFPPNLVLPLLKAGNPAKGPVLDPFGGAGTVGLVADRLGMEATLIELNQDSVEISDRRIMSDGGLFSSVTLSEPS